jgi:cyclopropane fatty-acyl-phospholipid synthase-like methyltransferase
VTDSANSETLQAYESRADVYRDTMRPAQTGWFRDFLERIVAALPPGARVLEIGSGTGANARLLAGMGLELQPSDATRAFVEMMAADGLDAAKLNALTDDLGGPWDAVVAFAVFLHFSPDELAAVLAKARHGIRAGGVLAFTVKEGDGSGWSEHKLGRPRHFTYWRAGPLREFLEVRGWRVESLEREQGLTDGWLLVIARPVTAASAIVRE